MPFFFLCPKFELNRILQRSAPKKVQALHLFTMLQDVVLATALSHTKGFLFYAH